jgi:hypothetical protein
MDTGARNDNFTERINLVLDWRIQALGLLGVSRSKVSSDEPDQRLHLPILTYACLCLPNPFLCLFDEFEAIPILCLLDPLVLAFLYKRGGKDRIG